MRAPTSLLLLCSLLPWVSQGSSSAAQGSSSAGQGCFCQVTGYIDDCTCDVNLQKPCPFWTENSHCGISDCAVRPCPACTEKASHGSGADDECEKAKRLGAVDASLSEEAQEAVMQWTKHDDSSANFCEADDEESPDAEYVDLLLNPERYTGYKGSDAWKVWNSIYEENCFKYEDFRQRFRNISRIMECVGCFKCRLWGKLQTQGLGTALKILFSETQIANLPERGLPYGFQLTRQEIVALLNAFGWISTSVKELENFRKLLKDV
ncbi:hypothetical protein FKM82_016525 [Ascaphus truei]